MLTFSNLSAMQSLVDRVRVRLPTTDGKAVYCVCHVLYQMNWQLQMQTENGQTVNLCVCVEVQNVQIPREYTR